MGLISLLIIAGILLLLGELFLTPGVGIAGILSVLALGSSCYLAFDRIGPGTGIIVTLVNILLITALLIYFLRGKTWKKFELNTVIESTEDAKKSLKAGDKGVTVTRLAPMGTARFDGQDVEVASDAGMTAPGMEVEIVRVAGNKLYVKPINNN